MLLFYSRVRDVVDLGDVVLVSHVFLLVVRVVVLREGLCLHPLDVWATALGPASDRKRLVVLLVHRFV